MQPKEEVQKSGTLNAFTSPATLQIVWTGEDSKLNMIGYPGLQTKTLGLKSSYAPALVVSPANVLYLAWTNQSGDPYPNYATSPDGVNFSQPAQIAIASSAAPSLTIFNGIVYIAWKGPDGLLNIMPITGSQPNQPAWTGADAPALGTINNSTLYVGWRDKNGNLFYMTSSDGQHFSAPVDLKQTSPHAPAFAEFNGFPFIAWTGTGDNHLNVMSLGATRPTNLGEASIAAPSLSAAGGQLYLGWVGQDSDQTLNLLSSSDGSHFGTKSELKESTNAGMSVVPFSAI